MTVHCATRHRVCGGVAATSEARNTFNDRETTCSDTSNDGDGRPEYGGGTSFTGRLARAAAVHPWRVVAAWGLILLASMVAIGGLLGSAFTSDASLTTNPDSARAEQVLADSFSQGDRIDDAVIIYSAQLTSDAPEFRAFVADVRSSIEATGAAQPSGTPTQPTSRPSPRTGTRRS